MLKTSKDYIWFLSNVEVRPIKKQQTMVFDWICKEENETVREYLRVCSPFVGCRLYNTMKALGWDETATPNMTPQTFFEKGLHIKAKPLMYWSELNSENMKWKLNYETLRPMNEDVVTLSDEDRRLFDRLCSSKGEYGAVLAHLATHRPELVEPFIKMCKSGEIIFDK